MHKPLRIVFMGTPEFAVASLQALHQSEHHVVAVVTVADKPAGRGLQLQSSPVKQYAASHHMHTLQPTRLRDPDFLEALKCLKADLFVVVAFRMLPEVVWQMPPLGTVNLHGSLLPQYRGAAPINWAIVNGEHQTGVTTFFLQQEIDTGNIIEQTRIAISATDTAGSLHDRMMTTGAATLAHTVDLIARGEAKNTPQLLMIDENIELKHAPKIFKEHCQINWTKTVDEVDCFVRGLSPYPAAHTTLHGKTMKVFLGKKTNEWQVASGAVATDGKTYLAFGCADGAYSITDLQLEGKKRMHVEEFLRGWKPS